ncbi:hydrogenase maturation nickel metallochaperone HypA [Prosthecochloris sp. N3]|uniref:Hydrogenase maturation factor HypA n=1 Tax=Prosthecochloris ethylica TaxID=2743976 RepID=A0ABR9XTQ9_9CHLB|nr:MULTISPECIES: hydrogenase maturation nickel metallochaperone HypA [Prosthecochloris]MEC9486065.1 hydrogenase maturation nickel metallochaperone HypA [Prosthecochloris sp.]MBF0587174.1 hydrogenase maturation nickel metallochaperone HypA [Prosthecochloris ethylica]MBF0637252.1 hydrogenase maturation nickel metallochaperone HypA [Prosthecochloris ethylica]NUK48443.1 hydrogenase maturation nickel metallochaperone HypA [Prosthecochloris ethylica]RNA68263.1 hydrogenase maturation nickel metalloch
MHEMSIALSIVDAVSARAREEGSTKVTGVEIVVGQLSGVEIPSLEFCFDAATRNTPLEGAKLDIVRVASEGECEQCGKRFGVDFHYAKCESCGSFRVRIVAGTELSIRSMTLE